MYIEYEGAFYTFSDEFYIEDPIDKMYCTYCGLILNCTYTKLIKSLKKKNLLSNDFEPICCYCNHLKSIRKTPFCPECQHTFDYRVYYGVEFVARCVHCGRTYDVYKDHMEKRDEDKNEDKTCK